MPEAFWIVFKAVVGRFYECFESVRAYSSSLPSPVRGRPQRAGVVGRRQEHGVRDAAREVERGLRGERHARGEEPRADPRSALSRKEGDKYKYVEKNARG